MYISQNNKSVYCNGKRKHCFDFSSDGYLGLNLNGGGDSREAVQSRKSFLESGYYSIAAEAIVQKLSEITYNDCVLLDAGCGEGYYTRMLSTLSEYAIGADLSKYACSYASRAAKKSGIDNLLYITGSVFELPVAEHSCDFVTNIFAPCAEHEFSRILKKDGYLVVVGAGKNHLIGLKKEIYENTYLNTKRADLPKEMRLISQDTVSFDITVKDRQGIYELFSMTPYYWRTSEKDRQKLDSLDTLQTRVEFEISIYKNINP